MPQRRRGPLNIAWGDLRNGLSHRINCELAWATLGVIGEGIVILPNLAIRRALCYSQWEIQYICKRDHCGAAEGSNKQ